MNFQDIGRAAFEAAQVARNGQDANASWPALDLSILSPHREPAPSLPLDVFGPFWAEWLGAAAEGKGAPVDFVAMPLFSVVGAMLANLRRASPWPEWTEAPLINTACVGLPSSSKSPGRDAALAPIQAIEKRGNRDLEQRQRDWRSKAEEAKQRRALWEADVKKAVKDGYAPPAEPDGCVIPDPPKLRRLLLVDVTTEKAARLAQDNRRGLLLARDELAGWLGSIDKYGGSADRPFWLESYNGGEYSADRVKDGDLPVIVPALAIGITGGIQPDRLASALMAGDDDGLASRFLYVWPERVPPRRPTRTADPEAAIERLAMLRRLPFAQGFDGEDVWRRVPFSDDAAATLQEWRETVAEWELEASGLYLGWLGKLPGTAARLALVLEYLWWCGDRPGETEPQEVSEPATLNALHFLEGYAAPMARRCFGDVALPQAERDAVALAKWIRRHQPETVNARDLRRGRAIPASEPERYEAALAELEQAGWVRQAPSPGGPGRPRKDWSINPAVRVLQ
jgi:hypothetical protein